MMTSSSPHATKGVRQVSMKMKAIFTNEPLMDHSRGRVALSVRWHTWRKSHHVNLPASVALSARDAHADKSAVRGTNKKCDLTETAPYKSISGGTNANHIQNSPCRSHHRNRDGHGARGGRCCRDVETESREIDVLSRPGAQEPDANLR